MSTWISVKDSMPEFGLPVAVLCIATKFMYVASYHKNNQIDDGEDYIIYADTCWYVESNDYETLLDKDVAYWCHLPPRPELVR